jgi:hypothetical protein
MPIGARVCCRTVLAAVLLPAALSLSLPSRVLAQADAARVSYRTTEIAFFTAGRAEGVRVGDTVAVLGAGDAVVARAVVVSASLHSASARLLGTDVQVTVGQRVRFDVHLAAADADTAAAPDSTGALRAAADSTGPRADTVAADSAVSVEVPLRRPPSRAPRPPQRINGGLQIEEMASSVGSTGALTSYQTSGSLYLNAPLVSGVELRTRVSARWRSGAAGRSTGFDGFHAIPYELQLRFGVPGGRVGAAVGRFVPTEAAGLGYLDGARLELRLGEQQRVGIVGGFVPSFTDLSVSTTTKRGGVYWAFGGSGTLAGSLSAAADWSGGARRRTLLASQTYWRLSGRLSLSASAEVDVGSPTTTVHTTRLTNGYANLRMDLPLGFRGSVGVESHQAILLWESVMAGDTTPPAGRLNGVSASLGHDLLGFRVDVSGGALQGANDAAPSYRGGVTLSRGVLFLLASGQHGDLFDYGALMARLMVPYRALPFNASLGASASFTRTAGGAVTQWRYSIQPELSRSVGSGLFASLGGDIGTFAGRTSAFLHAGVSYRFR